RQRRILIRRTLNIVKSDHRHVIRHSQLRFSQGANRAHCRNVIERKNCSEWLPGGDQFPRSLISQFWGRRVPLKLPHQGWMDRNLKLPGRLLDVGPTNIRVGTELLAFDERDLAMSQLGQMLYSPFGCPHVVQHDISDTL